MNTENLSINERFSLLMFNYFLPEDFKKRQNKAPQLRLNVSRETFYSKLYETYQKLRDIRDWGGKHSQDESDFNNIITDGIKANFKNFDAMKAFFVGKARDWYNTDLQKAIEKRIGI